MSRRMFCLAACLALSGWFAVPGGTVRAAAGVVLGSSDTMEKVFRDEPWRRPSATALFLEAARNEVEGIQLVVAADKSAAVRAATLQISDLCSETGSTLAAGNVAWYLVGYVETEKPAYPVRRVGWWPDPLLPARSFDVAPGQVQPLWINVRVPIDARPGLYRGTVTLKSDGRPEQGLPLEVRVWDFTMARQQHLVTCFPLRPEDLQKFYRLPAVPIELYEQWIDFCVDHRLSALLCDWPNFRNDMERLVSRQLDRGGACFCLGNAWFTQAHRRSDGATTPNRWPSFGLSTTGRRSEDGSTRPTSTATTRSARSSIRRPVSCTAR